MRVTGGRFCGRRLVAPRGLAVRPTSDRVREAIFSMLGDVSGTVVLDLFAGSGALGIEALSRGASHATFVDSSRRSLAYVRRNLRELGLLGAVGDEGESASCAVITADVADFVRGAPPPATPADIVFLDPPYTIASSLRGLVERDLPRILGPSSKIVIESATKDPLTVSLPALRLRRHGDTHVGIYTLTEVAA